MATMRIVRVIAETQTRTCGLCGETTTHQVQETRRRRGVVGNMLRLDADVRRYLVCTACGARTHYVPLPDAHG